MYVAEILYKRSVCYIEVADHDMARSDCKRVVDSKVDNRWRVMCMVRLAKLDAQESTIQCCILANNDANVLYSPSQPGTVRP